MYVCRTTSRALFTCLLYSVSIPMVTIMKGLDAAGDTTVERSHSFTLVVAKPPETLTSIQSRHRGPSRVTFSRSALLSNLAPRWPPLLTSSHTWDSLSAPCGSALLSRACLKTRL
jgi:hypothetical protein